MVFHELRKELCNFGKIPMKKQRIYEKDGLSEFSETSSITSVESTLQKIKNAMAVI